MIINDSSVLVGNITIFQLAIIRYCPFRQSEKCVCIRRSKIIFVTGINNPLEEFHAARALKYTPYHNDLKENIAPDWSVVVSKCSDFEELLIHREEQVSSKHGAVNRAYKQKTIQ